MSLSKEQRDELRHYLDAENLAAAFHAHYEELAPDYSYTTRPQSAVPWEDVPERNRLLMMATARAVMLDIELPALLDIANEADQLRRLVRWLNARAPYVYAHGWTELDPGLSELCSAVLAEPEQP